MTKRISIKDIEPGYYKAMMGLEVYASSTQIAPTIKELIKIRASQINRCAFCLDMHTEDALKLGETERRIFLLSAWKETHLFSDEERAALQLTEEVTNISLDGVSEATYQNAIHHFGEIGVAQLIMLIVTINAWNRICVATHAIYKP